MPWVDDAAGRVRGYAYKHCPREFDETFEAYLINFLLYKFDSQFSNTQGHWKEINIICLPTHVCRLPWYAPNEALLILILSLTLKMQTFIQYLLLNGRNSTDIKENNVRFLIPTFYGIFLYLFS